MKTTTTITLYFNSLQVEYFPTLLLRNEIKMRAPHGHISYLVYVHLYTYSSHLLVRSVYILAIHIRVWVLRYFYEKILWADEVFENIYSERVYNTLLTIKNKLYLFKVVAKFK